MHHSIYSSPGLEAQVSYLLFYLIALRTVLLSPLIYLSAAALWVIKDCESERQNCPEVGATKMLNAVYEVFLPKKSQSKIIK